MDISKYIKLRVPGERFWALPLSDNTAVIKNILVNPEYGLEDIVAHDGENVTCILVKKTETAIVTYQVPGTGDKTSIGERVNNICRYFEVENEIQTESAILGKILIAIPTGLPREVVLNVVKGCPEKIEIVFPEDQEQEEEEW